MDNSHSVFGGYLPPELDLSRFQNVPKDIATAQQSLSNEDPERDKKLYAQLRIFSRSHFETHESLQKQFPIYKSYDFFSIWIDQSTTHTVMVLRDKDGNPKGIGKDYISRFPKHWKAYKENKIVGYPIEQLPGIPDDLVSMLRSVGIQTMEGFVNHEGAIFDVYPTAKGFKKKAQKFLENTDTLLFYTERNKELETELKQALADKAKFEKLIEDTKAIGGNTSALRKPKNNT